MAMTATLEPARNSALQASKAALRRIASYELPAELDRRILELGERQAELTDEERAELLAWVEFTQQRSIEKLDAEVALRRLSTEFPELN